MCIRDRPSGDHRLRGLVCVELLEIEMEEKELSLSALEYIREWKLLHGY